MSRSSSKNVPTGFPEIAVRREDFNRFFSKPIPKSTFYDLVEKGSISRLKHLEGFYKLNDSLSRLGLREVPSLPEAASRSTEDIVRLAFSAIDPDVFPAPSWLLNVEAIDGKDADHAELIIARHVDAVMALGSDREKLQYLQGVLDTAAVIEADRSAESAGG
jgi:hypothetical protein